MIVLSIDLPKHYNLFIPSDAFIRHQIRTPLIRIKVCRLFGAEPLSELIMAYCQLDPWHYISVNLESEFSEKKLNPKCHL